MGNINVMNENKCLDNQIEEMKDCPTYKEHLVTEELLNRYGVIFEKMIYHNSDSLGRFDAPKISWYQLLGQSIKTGGQSMPYSDPFRNNIIMTGKAEKLIGQMEDEYYVVCNNLLLHPLQEIRIFCQTVLRLHIKLFLEHCQSLKELECKASKTKPEDQSFYQLTDSLNEMRSTVRDTHIQLHKYVIYVYDNLVNFKLKIPAMIEHQLQMNRYSSEYLSYLLCSFKDEGQFSPLRSFQGDFKNEIPDYRHTLRDESMYGPWPMVSTNQKTSRPTYDEIDTTTKIASSINKERRVIQRNLKYSEPNIIEPRPETIKKTKGRDTNSGQRKKYKNEVQKHLLTRGEPDPHDHKRLNALKKSSDFDRRRREKLKKDYYFKGMSDKGEEKSKSPEVVKIDNDELNNVEVNRKIVEYSNADNAKTFVSPNYDDHIIEGNKSPGTVKKGKGCGKKMKEEKNDTNNRRFSFKSDQRPTGSDVAIKENGFGIKETKESVEASKNETTGFITFAPDKKSMPY